jgi:hypothetical protein
MADPRNKSYERVCVSMPKDITAELRRCYPYIEFSSLVTQLVRYAHAAGYMQHLGSIKRVEGSEHGEIPTLWANAAQEEFATHAHRYICRATEGTANDDLRFWLMDVLNDIESSELTVQRFDELIGKAIELGWDKRSQAPAPVPKEGPGKKPSAPKKRAAKPEPEPVVDEVEEFYNDVSDEEVEEFGA